MIAENLIYRQYRRHLRRMLILAANLRPGECSGKCKYHLRQGSQIICAKGLEYEQMSPFFSVLGDVH